MSSPIPGTDNDQFQTDLTLWKRRPHGEHLQHVEA
jgi:hypothetical protein